MHWIPGVGAAVPLDTDGRHSIGCYLDFSVDTSQLSTIMLTCHQWLSYTNTNTCRGDRKQMSPFATKLCISIPLPTLHVPTSEIFRGPDRSAVNVKTQPTIGFSFAGTCFFSAISRKRRNRSGRYLGIRSFQYVTYFSIIYSCNTKLKFHGLAIGS